MSVANPPFLPSPPPPPGPQRPFTVDEYHRMIESGVLAEDDPVELLEGWVVFKMPRNPPHGGCVALVNRALSRRLPEGFHCRVQSAVTTDDSEPEPDVALVAGDERRYLTSHPVPGEVLLLVEVADSSLTRDRGSKARAYARAGVAAYWIVNLVDTRVEVYTDPSGPAPVPSYRSRTDFAAGQSVPLHVGGQVYPVPVQELLP